MLRHQVRTVDPDRIGTTHVIAGTTIRLVGGALHSTDIRTVKKHGKETKSWTSWD